MSASRPIHAFVRPLRTSTDAEMPMPAELPNAQAAREQEHVRPVLLAAIVDVLAEWTLGPEPCTARRRRR